MDFVGFPMIFPSSYGFSHSTSYFFAGSLELRLELLDDGPSLTLGIKGIEPTTGAEAQAVEELVDHQAW